MAHKKLLVETAGPMAAEKLDALVKTMAEHLGVAEEDILVLPAGVHFTVVEGVALKHPKEKKAAAEAAAPPAPEKHVKI